MRRITMQDVAVMSVQYVQYTFPSCLDSLAQCGVRKVDLWGGAPHYCRLDYASAAEAASALSRIRQEVERRGMQTVIYTPETLTYPFSYSAPDSALRARTLAYMTAAMEDALALGTRRVFLNSGCHPRDLDREEGWKRMAESFRALCDRAEQLGVTLILEQLQPYESNLITTLADLQRILAEVDSPALRCCADLTALDVAGETLEDFCRRLGDRLAWVHYSDSHHLVPGDGTFGRQKLEGYVRTLEQHGYEGDLDLEINDAVYWEDPHTSVQRSVSRLRAFLPER